MIASRQYGRMALCAAALLALATSTLGSGLPYPDLHTTAGRTIQFEGFVDEVGRPFQNLADDSRPWVVCPIYTRCPTTCSALTIALQSALARSGLQPEEYRVLVFSFDPYESDATLTAFRRRLNVPAAWVTLRVEQTGMLTHTLRGLDIRTIDLDDGSIGHPNAIAILSADLRVRDYLYGLQLSGETLAASVRGAGADAADGTPRDLAISMAALFTALALAGLRRARGRGQRSVWARAK